MFNSLIIRIFVFDSINELNEWQLILVDKLSYEEIGRRYGCTGSNIKNVARRIGIELPARRSINPSETFNRVHKQSIDIS